MYDELVKRLRETSEWSNIKWEDYSDDAQETMKQAADAIEELSRKYTEERNSAVELTGELASKPRWISVEERLPEHGVHVLAACHVKWLGGGGRYYVCDAFHTEHFTDTCSYNDDIDMEYDEDTDEYYMPEGWWEVIKNWDDYSCVAIGDFVTHWMPLPAPPKEET